MFDFEEEKNIEKRIMDLLFASNGKPFSLRQLKETLEDRDWKYDIRSVNHAVHKLEHEGKVRTTQLAKATAVYLPWNLPLVEERTSLDELAKRGQYPLYAIIAKMKDVGFPDEEILELGRAKIWNRARDLMENSQKEILWWAGDFSRFEELRPSMVKALKKNTLRFKVLMRVDSFSLKNAKMILNLQREFSNLEVRQWESQWRGAIFDRRKARLIEKIPKRPDAELLASKGVPGSDKDFKYRAFNVDSKKPNLRQWINWLCMIWESHWRTSAMGPKISTLVQTLSELL